MKALVTVAFSLKSEIASDIVHDGFPTLNEILLVNNKVLVLAPKNQETSFAISRITSIHPSE